MAAFKASRFVCSEIAPITLNTSLILFASRFMLEMLSDIFSTSLTKEVTVDTALFTITKDCCASLLAASVI
ncbi:Uncharacterised protein [Vibrio cholerae]|nr:Uncharacterised protein [Vibrio cholerae]CSC65760.1 Uncharacterised protein [Vibrio cholerae]